MKSWQDTLKTLLPGQHAVQFYTDDHFLARLVGFFIAEGLERDENALVIAARPHRTLFERAIEAASERPVEDLERAGLLTMLDADEMLALFMKKGMPDRERFESAAGAALTAASKGRPTRAYGEMVNILWQAGNRAAALALEGLWNDLLQRSRFSLLCAYAIDRLSPETCSEQFIDVCESHHTILPAEDAEAFDRSVEERLHRALGTPMSSMVSSMATLEDGREGVPAAQKSLLWLTRHMPSTAKKVLSDRT